MRERRPPTIVRQALFGSPAASDRGRRRALDAAEPDLTPEPVPVTLHGLAGHKDHQGRGQAGFLLLFALRTALRASREIESLGVVTHPIDDQVGASCGQWRFQDLPFDPRRAMIVRMIDLEKSGIGQ